MTKTFALLLDSYRELNARRLFWIVLIINVLAVLLCACVGIQHGYLTILVWKTPFYFFDLSPAIFYKVLFTYLGVSIWLTWAATILALVSTTGIFPEFIAGGSIDLYLSKPIARLWLFVTKYIGGLLFATMQVGTFAVFGFLLLGIRGHEWDPKIFLSIPLVVAVFSFLFCFCVLLGVLTRSAIAALLLTLLIWLFIFGAQLGESILLQSKIRHDLQIQTLQDQLSGHQLSGHGQSTNSWTRRIPFGWGGRQSKADMQLRLDAMKSEHGLEIWHRIAFTIVTVIPKTEIATDLLRQTLITNESKPSADDEGPPPEFSDDQRLVNETREQKQYLQHLTLKITDARGAWWSLGTSFAAEFVVAGLAAFIFCRRDY